MALFKKTKKGSQSAVSAQSSDSRKYILQENSPFAIKESYKALRTNVAFSLPGTESKVVAVTSGDRSEGKSFNTINLAIAFAQIGKKVILLDCDMRLPTVASKLGIQQKPGLSNVLVGETPPSEAIRTLFPGFDVLPAGSIPKDPTGLLQSKMMTSFVAKLREIYDYIFIDLPPVTTVTDASIISPLIDGFLIVVRHELSTFKEETAVLKQLELSGSKVLGFIYNDSPIEDKKYYKKYGYYK